MPTPLDEVIRSIADRDFIRGYWLGHNKDAELNLSRYWRAVTRGADSVWWFRWDGTSEHRGLIGQHMAPWPPVKEIQRDTQIVRDGLGTLLLKCRRQDDGIAMLYSYPSTFVNKLETGPSYYGKYDWTRTGSGWEDHQAWYVAVRAQGLQFSYVTDRMLRRGEPCS